MRNIFRKYRTQNPGVSLLIAMVFVSAFILIMGGLYSATTRVISAIGNREMEAKADYLAQSAFELASYWASTEPDGRNLNDYTAQEITALFAPLYQAAVDLGMAAQASDCQAFGTDGCVGFDVVGRAQDLTENKVAFLNNTPLWYSVPVRGKGNASECGSDSSDADDGCNWNRIQVGETVQIPLYYITTGTNANVAALTDDFKLRVRTPCKVESVTQCEASQRETLYPKVTFFDEYPFRNINKDPVVIQWSMEDTVNGTSILAWDENGVPFRTAGGNTMNTEISSGRINDANNGVSPSPPLELDNFVVLEKKYAGKNLNTKAIYYITNFLSDVSAAQGKPVLRLSMIAQPQRLFDGEQADKELDDSQLNSSERNVPYLEYQLLTRTNPVTDTTSYLTGWTEFGGFRKEFNRELNRSTSGGGFALENF